MRILYVTDSRHGHRAWLDPSARHRVYHYADCLAANGCSVQVSHIEDLSRSLVTQAEHIIFHRPKWTRRFESALRLCRQSSALLHADYDDLIFDTDYADFSPMFLNGNRPLVKVVEYFKNNFLALSEFRHILVSTRYLADSISRLLPAAKVTVLPNSIPRLFKSPQLKKPDSEWFTIGYFPGSNSHGHDLKQITEPLVATLKKNKKCRFIVAGKLDSESLKAQGLDALFLPYMDYNKYLKLLSMVDLSIAPLEDNPFNQAKSAVKLIESTVVGTPILVTDNQDMRDHENRLSTLIKDPTAWTAAFESTLNKNERRRGACNDAIAVDFAAQARLPILRHHLQCAA